MTDGIDDVTYDLALVRVEGWVTLGFGVLVALTHVSADSLDVLFALVCAALFLAGIVAFLIGFWNAVQRSRTDDVGLGGLLAINASNVPRPIRNRLWLINLGQVVIAVVAGSLRPFTGQAFALLVPMFGIGIAALWGARHALFHPRSP